MKIDFMSLLPKLMDLAMDLRVFFAQVKSDPGKADATEIAKDLFGFVPDEFKESHGGTANEAEFVKTVTGAFGLCTKPKKS